jgi:aldehyde:ferredoxin oxidoreductase
VRSFFVQTRRGKHASWLQRENIECRFDQTNWQTQTLDNALYKRLGGGSALGVYLVLQNTPACIDAYDPANTLVFSVSVITALPFLV